MMRYQSRRLSARRRGVVILIVLSMLVLFSLIGITYAVLAGNYLRAARAVARHEQTGDSPANLCDIGIYQALVETSNRLTVMRGHSLLRDLYGTDSVQGQAADISAAVPVGEQFIKLTLGNAGGFNALPGYYNGCVFTMQSGPAAGYSTRVVAYSPTSLANLSTTPSRRVATAAELTIEIPKSDDASFNSRLKAGGTVLSGVFVGRSYVINGRANNGAGFGWSNSSENLTANTALPSPSGTNYPIALLPNYYHFSAPGAGGTDPLPDAAGDADEGFDVPDYRDMWLSYIISGATASNQVIPSFHRPELVNYWRANGQSTDQAFLLSRSCLRPLPFSNANPYFTGSNPYLDFSSTGGVDPNSSSAVETLANRLAGRTSGGAADTACTWDVDNDRDGVADSVWLDLGLPPRRAPNGRLYKPLFAFLIRDLDGRVNLNAHGNPLQFTTDYTGTYTPPGGSATAVPRGHGWGPGEVLLNSVFSNDDAMNILGIKIPQYPHDAFGRVGADLSPGVAGTLTSDGFDPLFTRTMQQGMPGVYRPPLSSIDPAGFGAPPDVWGRGFAVVDGEGQPAYFKMGLANGARDEVSNEPYETNLIRSLPADTTYTAHEMERLLRPRDADSQLLAPRLAAYAALQDQANVAAVTVRSFDTAEATVHSPKFLRTRPQIAGVPTLFDSKATFSPHVADLMAHRLQATMLPPADAAANAGNQLTYMLALELVRGQRFNVNRPWGNGLDDDGNGVVDDPGELARSYDLVGTDANEKELAYGTTVPGLFADYQNDYPGPLPPSGIAALPADKGRLIYARQLYCLAMMTLDPGYTFPKMTFPRNDPDPAETTTADEDRELTATRIAQWAINVVDFRDPDAIMTPFEFDINPWNGWNVDGDLNTNDGGSADRRVVWGMEYPDLLLRETAAFHDRRVKDADNDNNASGGKPRKTSAGAIGDNDLDQYRMPQGSLFLEVYCPRPMYNSNPVVPLELYTIDSSVAKLDLARLAPAGGTGAYNVAPYNAAPFNVAYPVWRVAISAAHLTANANQSALRMSNSHPNSFSTNTVENTGESTYVALNRLGSNSGNRTLIDRIVWFANLAPSSQRDANKVYYNRMAAVKARLPAGSYAVIGPRAVTRVGSTNAAAPSQQRIEIASNTVNIRNRAGVDPNPLVGTNIRAPVGLVCAAAVPSAWPADPDTPPSLALGTDAADSASLGRGVGMSVSEPLPTSVAAPLPAALWPSAPPGWSTNGYYPMPTNTLSGYTDKDAYSTPRDEPFDNPHLMAAGNAVVTPLDAANELSETSTVQDYRTAFLQRLANPKAPFHPTYNPYITVDWMPIDLTVFNGQDKEPADWNDNTPAGIGEWDPEDPAPIDQTKIRFATRQRTGKSMLSNMADGNLWSADTAAPSTSAAAAGGEAEYFPYNLVQTLGFLNSGFGAPLAAPNLGSPPVPFPWLTWNNRPFLNPYEIMDVPASAPERLGLEHSIAPGTPAVYTNDRHPYGHLLNFFDTSTTASEAAQLHRLLDFVTIPSPFVDTVKYYNAGQVSTAVGGLKPPFSGFSRYREPGKINLNTLSDFRVLEALTGVADNALASASPPVASIFAKFNLSRRGFSNAFLDDAFPSRFAGAFRSASGGDLGPIANMQQKGVNATLLRADPDDASVPLFADNTTTNNYRGVVRNPHFRYERLTRLSGLTTNRSNVFAMWVTVGFFEWDPTVNAPQGALGQELGSETGEVKRHRAFCLIDRTIPVAFSPGQYNNVDRCILVRRYLE